MFESHQLIFTLPRTLKTGMGGQRYGSIFVNPQQNQQPCDP
jgi:hypothetical protein